VDLPRDRAFPATGELLPPPRIDEIQQVMNEHLEDHYAFYGEFTGVRTARKHIGWYTRGLSGANVFRHRISVHPTRPASSTSPARCTTSASSCCPPAAPRSCWPRTGLPVTEVSEITGFPEMLDGRVKTLHPRVHGGLLARRDVPEHMAALKEHGIGPSTCWSSTCTRSPRPPRTRRLHAGGRDREHRHRRPAMLRAAAKNWQDVTVVVDPADYAQVLAK
jgi:hypothetical protein